MNNELSSFAARLRGLIDQHRFHSGGQPLHYLFDSLALELFGLQFNCNPAYRKICEARQLTPKNVEHWMQLPFVPTSTFKELELSSIPADERTAVFHSSGTTEQKPSRHFHCGESLALYETSVIKWFQFHFGAEEEFIFLTPDQNSAPHSSLIHMFETVRHKFGRPASAFMGTVSADGSWVLDFERIRLKLKAAGDGGTNLTLLGTAFSFVHLLDFMVEKDLRFQLPKGSRVMETGGYKNRSRTMPKRELHDLIKQRLGIQKILCEYGMSELSSQAYNSAVWTETEKPGVFRKFQFPPWARVQIISPETGMEVADGETGIIRICDLANVFSVADIQTEDLGVRLGDHFDLIGRAQPAEPRGCSLMSA